MIINGQKLELGILVSDELRQLNKDLHINRLAYGRHSYKHFKAVHDIIDRYNVESLLDYGCGKATLSIAFEIADFILDEPLNLKISNFDPCIKSFSSLPSRADLVVCMDVMEHIEEDKVKTTLEYIAYLTNMAAYFTISTRLSRKILPNGRNSHITVKDLDWWTRAITEYFNIVRIETTKKGELRIEAVPKN